MKKPTQIKIGPLCYDVHYPELEPDDMARINYKYAKIDVDGTMPEQAQKQSICHEIGHAILRARTFEAGNEQSPESLGDAILDVVQNNPVLIAWLVKKA